MEKLQNLKHASGPMPPKRKRFNLLRESLGNPSQLMLMREIREKSYLQGCQTVLDVGCGNCSPLRFLSELHIAGLDGYPPALEEARRNCTHNEYILGDVKGITQLFLPGPKIRCLHCVGCDRTLAEGEWLEHGPRYGTVG